MKQGLYGAARWTDSAGSCLRRRFVQNRLVESRHRALKTRIPVTIRKNLPDSARKPDRAASPGALRESAIRQRRTRQEHSQERAQDYVEAIADLIADRGEARATDLARSLGVTHATVIAAVRRLRHVGLVTTEPYRSIFLTPTGRRLAAKVKARHETIVAFLVALGVSPSAARDDAEGIEHHVSAETLAAMGAFLGASPRRAKPVRRG